MNQPLFVPALLCLAAAPLSLGCSQSGPAPVSGRVTLDGQPLAGAHVSFQPQATGETALSSNAGSGSYAVTAADGSYSLRLVLNDRPGAVAGKHRVEIVMKNNSDDDTDRRGKPPPLAKRIPARYNRDSELSCEVPAGGRSDANFELKSK